MTYEPCVLFNGKRSMLIERSSDTRITSCSIVIFFVYFEARGSWCFRLPEAKEDGRRNRIIMNSCSQVFVELEQYNYLQEA